MYSYTGPTTTGLILDKIKYTLNSSIMNKEVKIMQKSVLKSYSKDNISLYDSLKESKFLSYGSLTSDRYGIYLDSDGIFSMLDIHFSTNFGNLHSSLSTSYNVSYTNNRIFVNLFGCDKLDIPEKIFSGNGRVGEISRATAYTLENKPIRLGINLRRDTEVISKNESLIGSSSVFFSSFSLESSEQSLNNISSTITNNKNDIRNIAGREKKHDKMQKNQRKIRPVVEYKVNKKTISNRISASKRKG